jgi:hypothetical protein
VQGKGVGIADGRPRLEWPADEVPDESSGHGRFFRKIVPGC